MSNLEADCIDMLRLLIESNSMELLIATRPGGIYHRKIGIFYDQFNNYISFSFHLISPPPSAGQQ